MTRRLDGNSVLIIESDKSSNQQLNELFSSTGAQIFSVCNLSEALIVLKKFEFDVVICSYYLPDGLIHHVIDWSKANLPILPVFIALGSINQGDEFLLRRHLISGIFLKGDYQGLIKEIQACLFDFNEFYESLLSMVEPRGISLELILHGQKIPVSPLEVAVDGIFISTDVSFEVGTFAILRVSIFDKKEVENFTMVGMLGGKILGGQHFRVNEAYAPAWIKLLVRLEERQISITGFLGKAAGN